MLLLIDAHSLIHRCYHALPPLTNKKGEPTGALYGVASVLLKTLERIQPAYCAALLDRPEPTFRKEKFSDYKAHRPKTEDDLVQQLARAGDLFNALSIHWLELAGYEADDLIGTIATQWVQDKKNKKDIVRILTGDLDALQLVQDGCIEVETFKKGISETHIYNEAEVEGRYGIKPSQLIDYKALVGDASDNIPGVTSIGPKTASDILKTYSTLDTFLQKGTSEKSYQKIESQKDQAFLSRMLATIHTTAPLKVHWEDLAYSFSAEKALVFFRENNFTSLIQRTEKTSTKIEKKNDVAEKDMYKRVALQLLEKNINENQSWDIIEKELRDAGLWVLWETIERPLVPIIAQIQKNGVRVNKEKLKRTRALLSAKLTELKKELFAFFGDSNINSPKQVLEIIQKKTGLKISSTSARTIEKIKKNYPILETLLKYREFFKLKSTYLIPLEKLIKSDGRIHPTFIQIGAATGRIACQNPNLQNIPQESEWSGAIRDAFEAEREFLLVSCDYSQIELRVLAHLSQDTRLCEAFLSGADIHTRTAAFIFGVSDAGVDKQMRRTAKTLNFGMIYGMGHRAFAQSAGITAPEAKKFIEKYFQEFSLVKTWQEEIVLKATRVGFVQNQNGRIRHLPELFSTNAFFASEARRAAINMPTQSIAADILKRAMIRVDTVLKKYAGKARLILTIHDELIFEIHHSLIHAGTQSDIIKDICDEMESAEKLLVPLVVKTSIGKTWKELSV